MTLSCIIEKKLEILKGKIWGSNTECHKNKQSKADGHEQTL